MPGLVSLANLLLVFLIVGPWKSFGAPAANECKCPESAVECVCFLKSWEKLPTELLKKCASWKRLDFSLGGLTTLDPTGQLRQCRQLESLSFFANSISSTLTKETFEGLDRLNKLNVSHNKIAKLKGDTFASTPRLRVLDLRSNKIRVISNRVFQSVKELERLLLNGNYIGYIAEGSFRSLTKLKYLLMSENNLTTLRHSSFQGLTSLLELNVTSNPINKMEANVFTTMPSLSRLTIGRCGRLGGVKTLERSPFKGLTQLTNFSFIDCRLETIADEAFTDFTKLQVLSLRKNLLLKINPEVWRSLGALRQLDLSYNQLRCLYDGNFQQLTELRVLDLSNNHITYISESAFFGLVKLQTLKLNGNPVRFIQKDAFCRLNALSLIDLRGVPVSNITQSKNSNSTLNGSIAALPKSVVVQLSLPVKGVTGKGLGCSTNVNPMSSNDTLRCPVSMAYMPFPMKQNSRQYLLIIIGVCVGFLLMAMAIILSYRAWSKRKRMACEKAEQAALEEEKQEMMEKPATGASSQANGGNPTTELLAAGRSAENGVVLHHPGSKVQVEKNEKGEESTLTHLAVM